MNATRSRPKLSVTTGGKGVVSHVGTRLLVDLADALGLSDALSAAMAPTKVRRRGHDRGQVLVDLAVAIGDGARSISDLEVLAHQPELFGEVASVPTVWRVLEATDDRARSRIATARAKARQAAWAAGADPGYYVIDLDATIVISHSEKEGAGPTYKGTFGYSPIVAYLDASGEPLAGLLRPGNASPGRASDLVTVLDDALYQLPLDPADTEITVRSDVAGCSHDFVDAVAERGLRFCVGHKLSAEWATVIMNLPESSWLPTLSADGTGEREGSWAAEITNYVDLSNWPPGARAIARREEAHPGAQLTFSDFDGHRYQVFITDLDADVAFCEATYRGRGRAECAIRDAKDAGLERMPSGSESINAAWLSVVLIAGDLLAWMKRLCLTGELAKATPGRLRYALLHTAGQVVRSGRRITVRIGEGWPWALDLVEAFGRIPGWCIT
jgi:DDE family transposase